MANATIGHVIFAFAFTTVGLIVMFICVRWKIEEEEKKFTIHYCFKSEKTYTFQEVDKVEIGAKGELVVYVGERKVRTIDALATNRINIERKFESEGKIVG